jgi:hypothetical protein
MTNTAQAEHELSITRLIDAPPATQANFPDGGWVRTSLSTFR